MPTAAAVLYGWLKSGQLQFYGDAIWRIPEISRRNSILLFG
jgi:hypothetical protein